MVACSKALLVLYGAVPSKSRRGNRHDNSSAHAGLFWSCFKIKLLDSGSFPDLAEAKP